MKSVNNDTNQNQHKITNHMKTGKSLVELATELERQKEAKKDYVCSTSKMSMVIEEDEPRLAMHGSSEGPLPLTETAHSQVAQRLKIPTKYYNRMRTEMPDLLTNNVNKWLDRQNDDRLVRTMDGKARAFLSNRYQALDNAELAEAVLPILVDAGASVESCEITEDKFYIKAIIKDRREEIAPVGLDYEWGKGHNFIDIVHPGCVFSNSETGKGSLMVQPAVHTKACTNLAMFSDNHMKKYHIGAAIGTSRTGAEVWNFLTDETRRKTQEALWGSVRDLARAAIEGDVFDELVNKLRVARGHQIGDPVKAAEKLSNDFRMTDNERGGVLAHLITGGDLSTYGMHSAVTRYSQDVEDYDRATELERIGGEIIEAEWTAHN